MSGGLEDILRCDFCKTSFVNVVKLVPECGSSICGACNSQLSGQLNANNEFKCQACERMHDMPQSGLADVKALVDLLLAQRSPRELEPEERRLQATIDGVSARIGKLQEFNKHAEINVYCDSLEMEVADAVESAVRHVNKIGDDLLTRINFYRQEMLRLNAEEADAAPEKAAKRFRDAPSDERVRQTASIERELQQELATLAAEIERLRDGWQSFFEDASVTVSDAQLFDAQQQADGLEQRTSELENSLTSSLFNGRFMRFKGTLEFLRSQISLGDLYIENSLQGHVCKEKLVHTFAGSSGNVFQALFLETGELVTCSKDYQIKIWDPWTGQLMYELVGHRDWVFSIAKNDYRAFVSGSRDGSIFVWNLLMRKSTRQLIGHTAPVVSLKFLPNGNLASLGLDDTIRIWNVYWPAKYMIAVLSGVGVERHLVEMCVTPRGALVTCSNEDERDNTIRVWNTKTMTLYRLIRTDSRAARAVLCLLTGSVAVGFTSGLIKIYDVDGTDESPLRVMRHGSAVYSLLQLPNSQLLSAGTLPEAAIKIWDPIAGRLVQTIMTGHNGPISSLCLSSNLKYLASTSFDRTVKVWALTY